MTEIIKISIICFASALVGIVAGNGAVYFFNRLPEKWLYDKSEKTENKQDGDYSQRIKSYPWKWIFSAFFVLVAIKLTLENITLGLTFTAACWVLVLLAVAIWKYKEISDQLVLLLTVMAAGFIPFHEKAAEPLWGLVTGGILGIIIWIVGKYVFHREHQGIKEIKLSSSLGMMIGIKGMAAVIVTSGVLFGTAFIISGVKERQKKSSGAEISGKGVKPLSFFMVLSALIYLVFLEKWIKM